MDSGVPWCVGYCAITRRGREAPVSGDAAVDDFQNYADCIDRVEPDDTAGLERCNALLNP